MLFNFFFLISNFLILFVLIKFQNKYKFLLDNSYKSFHKTHKGSVPLSGGHLIMINIVILYLFIDPNLNIFVFYASIFFYLIGVLSDVYEKFEPSLRLILQSILIFLFIYLNKSILSNLDIEFINFFIQNHIVNSLFLSFCTIVLINGLNLLDGKNGLVSINLLIIIFILFLINQKNNNFDTTYVFLIIIILVFLIFNLFGKCFLGDSGVYVFGFLITYLVVETYNKSSLLSSVFIVNLLWLPCFENLFSIIRRFSLKKVQITSADKRHLHHLLDRLLIKKYKLNNNLSSTITGIVINFYYLLTITLAYNFMWNRTINIIILLFNVLFYVIVYIELLKTNYKIKII